MIVLRISAKPLLLAVLAASLAFQTAIANQERDAGAFIAVTEDSVKDLLSVTRDYAAASRGGAIGPTEFGTLEALSRERLSKYQRSVGGNAAFDRRASHYIAIGSRFETQQERLEHLQTCPVCHGLIIEFLEVSAIQLVPLVLEFTRVSIARPTGGRLTLSLDRDGYLYAIDSLTNRPEPVPVSQLVRTETDWYATDGYHWEGPLTSDPRE